MLTLADKEVFEYFKMEAKGMKRRVYTDGDNYMLIKGTEPTLCLVAHIDMIRRGDKAAGKIVEMNNGIVIAYRNKAKGRERDILGADDRAGCFALLQIMREDPRPNILLTNHEEVGGRGARVFAHDTNLWKHFKLFIEFDRHGCNHYVQYNDNPQSMHSWLANFGIKNDGYGSYSDIATISGHTNIPSFNMAIGYTNQHSDRESLDISAMNLAISKASLMIHDFCSKKLDFGMIQPKKQVYYERPVFPQHKIEKPKHDVNAGWVRRIEDPEEIYCEACLNYIEEGHEEDCQYYVPEHEIVDPKQLKLPMK